MENPSASTDQNESAHASRSESNTVGMLSLADNQPHELQIRDSFKKIRSYAGKCTAYKFVI